MAATSSRALHYVFKIGDRNATAQFYRDVLGMKVLRHEEFDAGCDAACNGPYDGKWSKTMNGYGPEDDYFACELTYNYGISTYKQGNSFLGLYIRSAAVIERATGARLPMVEEDGHKVLEAPGGYKFFVKPETVAENKDPVYKVSLASSDLSKTVSYWGDLLGMRTLPDSPAGVAHFTYGDDQIILEFKQIEGAVDHAKAGGRLAFACPSSQLMSIEAKVKEAGHTILTPYISLDTPGKATVQVVILADPDGHEICFVGDEGFRQLSQVDPMADYVLSNARSSDGSDAWFADRGGKQVEG